MYSGYGDQANYQDTDERWSKRAMTDWDTLWATGYGDQSDYQSTDERQSTKAMTDWDEPGTTGYGDQADCQDSDERQRKTARTNWDALGATGYGDQSNYQDTDERQSKMAITERDTLGATGYVDQTDYQDTDERQSKTARTAWDEPGDTTQYSHGYQDSGYTSSSTRYPEYLTDPVKHSHKADYSSWDSTHDGSQNRRNTRNLASYHGFSSVKNVPKSDYSSKLQGYTSGGKTSFRSSTCHRGILASGNKGSSGRSGEDTFSQRSGSTNWYDHDDHDDRKSASRSGSALGQTQNYEGSSLQNQAFSSHSAADIEAGSCSGSELGQILNYDRSSYSNLLTWDDRFSQQNQAFSSSSEAVIRTGSHSGSALGQTQNYEESNYSNLLTGDEGFSQQIQGSSSYSVASVIPDFDQSDNLTFGRDPNIVQKNQSVQSNHPADTQGSFTFEDRYEEEEDLRIGIGYSSQHGMFKEITSVNVEPAVTLDTSQNRSQQEKKNQNRISRWESQRNYGKRDFHNTHHRSRSNTSRSLQHDDTKQGNRSVLAQGKDQPDFGSDLALRMAAEIQQTQQAKADINKNLKAMKNVNKMSETEDATINQGFVGAGSRGITAKLGFGISQTQDFLGMRGSSGRQHRSSSRGGRINMMKQGVGMGLTGQESQMGIVSQGSMMCEDGGMDMMDEDDGTAMMGSRFGQSMTEQTVGMNMTGRERRNRTFSSDKDFVGNHGVRGQNKYMDSITQKGIKVLSGRQARSSSQGGTMNMMGQGVGLTGQGSQMGIKFKRQGASVKMITENADIGLLEQDTSRGVMGQDVHKEMVGQGSMMREDGGKGMMGVGSGWGTMGPGSGWCLAEQVVGMGMNERESRNRTTFSDETFVGNHEDRVLGPNKHRVPFMKNDFANPPKQEREWPRSLLDMSDKVKKYTMAQPNSHSQGPPIQPRKISLFEKFSQFLKFLKTEDLTRNYIHVIDNAVDKSRLGLQKDFKFEPFLNAEKKEMVSARLLISGIFLARVSGTMGKVGNGKEVKSECYKRALKLLLTHSAEDIMKQKDPKKEIVTSEKTEELKDKKSVNEEVVDAEKHEFRKKLGTLIQHVRSITTDDDGDYVLVLIDDMTEFGMDYSYSDEETKSARGVPWFIGNLKICNLHVGVGSGPSKMYAKRRTFSRAINFLKTKDLSKVMQGLAVQERDLIPEFELLCEATLPNRDTEEKLTKMIDLVLKMPEGKPVKRGIHDSVRKSDLRIVLLFKKGHSVQNRRTTRCDLFVDKIFISSGEAFKRAEAESQAYQEALTVLCSSSADVIFNDFKRMSREDSKDLLEMVEVGTLGQRKTLFISNASKVAKQKAVFNDLIPEEEESSEDVIDKDEIIIMENKRFSSDRNMNAYIILRSSAVMNLMLLECKITSGMQDNICCTLYLQHMTVAQGYMLVRREATTLAAARALFKLYQTRPTIGIAERDEILNLKNTFTYETMKAKADALKEECGDTDDDDFIYIASDAGCKRNSEDKDEDQMEVEDEDEEEEVDETPTSTLPVNKWLKQIIEEMIKKFASEESLEEIIFSGEFPAGDRSQIRLTADKYNIDTSMYKRNGLNHVVVYQKHLPAKILEILQNNDGHSGLYSIIPKNELPKPSDILNLLKPPKNKDIIPRSNSTEAQHFHSGFRRKRRRQRMP